MTTKQPEAKALTPPAFIIPGVSPKFPPALLAAAEKMAAQTAIVAKARAGAEALERKAVELRNRVASLKEEIEHSDGAAAAAVAMGIEKDDPDRKTKVAARIAELAEVEKDLAETTRAQAAAPELFEQVRRPLTDAVAAFEREYAAAERVFADWAIDAQSVLAQAVATVKHFSEGVKRHGAVAAQTAPSDMPAGHPMALFPQLRDLHSAFKAAESADRPLIQADASAAAAEPPRERMVAIRGGRS